MSRRNLVWLGAIVAVGAVVWIAFGVVAGLIAGGVVLLVSEVVERTRRSRRRAPGVDASGPSIREAIGVRRRRR